MNDNQKAGSWPATDDRSFGSLTQVVVVGISTYGRGGLRNLPAAAAEAAALSRSLNEGVGIPLENVTLIPEGKACRDTVLASVRDRLGRTGPKGILIVYFAGHASNLGTGFTLHVPPSPGEVVGGVSADELEAALGSGEARGILVILDCCGGAALTEHAPAFFRSRGGGFRLLLSACRADESSWEGDEGSMFTRRLLDVLGRRETVGKGDAVYFFDLYNHLSATVADEASRRLGKQQHPVFAGTIDGDPLLFAFDGARVGSLRSRLERLTPADVRRRVRATAIAMVALVGVTLGSFWAYMDQHRYFELRDDQVLLVHGYPGLSGFGYPRNEWVYSLGQADLALNGPLSRVRTVVFGASSSPTEKLLPLLRPAIQAKVLAWARRIPAAREKLPPFDGSSAVLAAADANLLALVTTADDVPALEHAGSATGDLAQQSSAVHAILKFDAEKAAALALRFPMALPTGFGYQLDLIEGWPSPCGPEVQRWFDTIGTQGAATYLSAFASAAVGPGCRLPFPLAISAPRDRLKAVVYAIRVTSAADAEALGSLVRTGLSGIAASGREIRPDVRARAFALARHLELAVTCDQGLEDLLRSEASKGSLDAAVILVRVCRRWAIRGTTGNARRALELVGSDGQAVALPVDEPSSGIGFAVEAITALEETDAFGTGDFARDLLRSTESAETRIYLANQLRRMGADGHDALHSDIPARPDLTAALLRWLGRSDPGAAANFLETALSSETEPPSVLVETIGYLDLTPEQRTRLAHAASRRGEITRSIAVALAGSADEAAGLLADTSPGVRARATEYVAARADWLDVANRARHLTSYADPSVQDLTTNAIAIARLRKALDSIPPWAVAWRADWLENLGAVPKGAEYALAAKADSSAMTWSELRRASR